ncbi:ANTAR domain-containing protein [Jannaschia sp. R86511]|uniref:ANTAR domain-containing protein n=1 Tax=Jannaschia sp. R86511 TaxID=3093853 RepID=UPI0036D28634
MHPVPSNATDTSSSRPAPTARTLGAAEPTSGPSALAELLTTIGTTPLTVLDHPDTLTAVCIEAGTALHCSHVRVVLDPAEHQEGLTVCGAAASTPATAATAPSEPVAVLALTHDGLRLGHVELGPPADGDVDALLAVAAPVVSVLATGLAGARLYSRSAALVVRLSVAMESRSQVEQAKGALMAGLGLPAGEAFALLRGYARRHRITVAAAAAAVLDGACPLLPPARVSA